jgi:polyketide biosynthesis enoyl-CoA hydratase PksI
MSVELTSRGPVAIISIANPENNNAVNQTLVDSLKSHLAVVEGRSDLNVVVVHGDGNFFCSGGTKEQLIEIVSGRQKFTDLKNFDLFLQFPLPVIVAMNGHAFGGGFVLGLYADLLVLSEESLYSSNFMKFGITPGMGGTKLLPLRMGRELAREMMWTANVYYGSELARRNPELRCFKKDQVVEKAIQLALEVAQAPRKSLMTLKQHLNKDLRSEMPLVIEEEVRLHDQVIDQSLVDRISSLIRKG